MRVRPLLEVQWADLLLDGGAPYRSELLMGKIVLNRMERVLEAWQGTPYGSGQRCRGVAADCVGFGFGAVDDLDGRPRAQDPKVPADTAFHDPGTASAALQALRAHYAPILPVQDGLVQPFDLLVVGPSGGGPGHLLLVGPRRNTLWQATQEAGVHCTGWGLGTGMEDVYGAFRIGDRWRWARREGRISNR